MPFDDPVLWVSTLPFLAVPLFVLVSAALEFVVPPYWGDTFLLLAFFLGGKGLIAPELVFLLGVCGSVVGAAAAFLLGRRYGLSVVRKVTLRRRRGARKRMLQLLEHHGERVLVANRFIPVVRGLALYVAGALQLRFLPSMFYNGVSSVLWMGFLMACGLLTADTWEELQSSVRQAQGLVGLVATLAVLAVLAWLWVRSSRVVDLGEPLVRPEGDGDR